MCITIQSTQRIFSIGNLLGEANAQRAGIASNAAIFMALALSATSRFVCFVLEALCSDHGLVPCSTYSAIPGDTSSTMTQVSLQYVIDITPALIWKLEQRS